MSVKRKNGRYWYENFRSRVAINQKMCCKICGALVQWHDMEIDHIRPLHKGGNNDINNLQMLCHECHRKKTASENMNMYCNPFDKINGS